MLLIKFQEYFEKMYSCFGALRKKCLNVLKYVRRKGSADPFDVKNANKRIYVCEFHFKDEDLTTTLGRGKRKVKAGRVPSIFREPPVKQKAT